MSPISNDEEIARAEYIELNKALNRSLARILDEFPSHRDEIAVSLPSLDNNIWVSYPQIQELILSRLENSRWVAPTPSRNQKIVELKRSKIGVSLELCLQIFAKPFRVRSLHPSQLPLFNKTTTVFTYSDFDPIGDLFFKNSQFWGPLPSWFESDQAFSWVGVGRADGQNPLLKQRMQLAINFIRSLWKLFHSVPIRLKFWASARHELKGNLVFLTLRKEFFRGVFGAPALQAIMLSLDFQSLLARTGPKAVLIPYENQLWERTLIAECRKHEIPVAGAIHTTARFWDLRFIDLDVFSRFQPTFIISNGVSAESLLKLGDFAPSRIISGSALRFAHLKDIQSAPLIKEPSSVPKKVLVMTGVNLKTAAELINLLRSSDLLAKSKIVFRPHPSTLRWFSKNFGHEDVDTLPLPSLLKTYGLFVTESISSMTLELVTAEARVFVYSPKRSLNFSALATVSDFRSYFADENSLGRLLDKKQKKVDVSELLQLYSSKSDWAEILRDVTERE